MQIVSVMAHQDDELMCLGTMLKYRARGHQLHFICLTGGEMGMVHRPEMTPEEAHETRRREMSAMVEAVGGTYQCLGYEDEFLYDTKPVRVALIDALRRTEADVVFTHNLYDYNLDHMTVNALVRQSAMQMSFPMIRTDAPPTQRPPAIFMVEPALGFDFEPTHWVNIDGVYAEKSRLAKLHKSQDEAFKTMNHSDNGIVEWMSTVSSHRGAQCGCGHAEAFRPLMTRGFIRGEAVLP